MGPPDRQSVSRLATSPASPSAHTTVNPTTGNASVRGKSLKPFIFYNPSHPTTVAKPISDHSREEIRALTEKDTSPSVGGPSPSSARKRPLEATDTVTQPAHTSPSKRQRPNGAPTSAPAPTLPPTIAATLSTGESHEPRRLRFAASECWYYLAACDTADLPAAASQDAKIASDADYQASQPFHMFRRHKSTYFRCIPCLRDHGIWKVWRATSGGGTTRYREHFDTHHTAEFREKCQAEGVILPAPGGSTLDDEDDEDLEFSYEMLETYIAQWAAIDDQAMNVVERREFRRLLVFCSRATRLYDTDIPHRTKLTTVTDKLYEEEMVRIRKGLKEALGHVCVTTDLWSDEVLRSFMAVTVHYMNNEGNLDEHLLAFRRIEGRHTGANLGQKLYDVLKDAGVLDKLGHITLDNASNNDTLMAELKKIFANLGKEYDDRLNRIRCFPHIINLVVQAILEALAIAARRFREEAAAEGQPLDEEFASYLDALESCPVDICRDSVRAMRSSDVRREGLRSVIAEGNLQELFRTAEGQVFRVPTLQLLHDCPTRWSSTYNMIARYLELYPAVDLYARRNAWMKIPVASHKQFEVLQDISSVLSILHHAQELLSAERTPTLALALPVYEALIHALQDAQVTFPELAPAIDCGIQKLQLYVSKARNQPVYALAMAINPCLKLNWIAGRSEWCERQRQEARVVVKEAMLEARQEQHRKFSSIPSRPSRAERASQAQQHGYKRLLTVGANLRRASSSIGSSAVPKASEPSPRPPTTEELLIRHMADVDAELFRWEQFEWEDDETMGTINLVEFWKAHRYMFPLLYQVAMNILPAQASSVSSERAFSSSKMTCTRERNNISPEHMEHLQVLKHSLHRRRATHDNYQTLDFMAHIVGEENADEPES